VHHRNQFNAFCLADDAMEPLRTLIDEAVLNHADHSQEDELNVNPATKRMLISALGKAVRSYDHDSPLLVALDRYAADLRRAICDGDTLSPPTPLHAG
jgi:CRISPR-associated protein Cas1